jgi:hypothetical protein
LRRPLAVNIEGATATGHFDLTRPYGAQTIFDCSLARPRFDYKASTDTLNYFTIIGTSAATPPISI